MLVQSNKSDWVSFVLRVCFIKRGTVTRSANGLIAVYEILMPNYAQLADAKRKALTPNRVTDKNDVPSLVWCLMKMAVDKKVQSSQSAKKLQKLCKNLETHKNSLSSSGNTNCYSLRIFRNVNLY